MTSAGVRELGREGPRQEASDPPAAWGDASLTQASAGRGTDPSQGQPNGVPPIGPAAATRTAVQPGLGWAWLWAAGGRDPESHPQGGGPRRGWGSGEPRAVCEGLQRHGLRLTDWLPCRGRSLPPACRISATNATTEHLGTALARWDPCWVGLWGEGRQALLNPD